MQEQYKRCGHCGRKISEFNWEYTRLWCESCGYYICRDCAGGGKVCPACGDEVKSSYRNTFLLLFFPAAFGFILTMMYRSSYPNQGFLIPYYYYFAVMGVFGVSSLVYFLNKMRIRYDLHEKHVSELPEGPLPPEERKSDILTQEKWKEKAQEESYRRSFLFKDIYDEEEYHGLKANWTSPVLSGMRGVELADKVMGIIKSTGVFFFSLGIILLFLAFIPVEVINVPNFVFMLIGTITLLIGVIVFFLYHFFNQFRGGEDQSMITQVSLKSVDREEVKEAMGEYLSDKEFELEKSSNKLITGYKYELDNSLTVEVNFYNSESETGYVMLKYLGKNYIYAKRIQGDLDKLLVEWDLVERGG